MRHSVGISQRSECTGELRLVEGWNEPAGERTLEGGDGFLVPQLRERRRGAEAEIDVFERLEEDVEPGGVREGDHSPSGFEADGERGVLKRGGERAPGLGQREISEASGRFHAYAGDFVAQVASEDLPRFVGRDHFGGQREPRTADLVLFVREHAHDGGLELSAELGGRGEGEFAQGVGGLGAKVCSRFAFEGDQREITGSADHPFIPSGVEGLT